MEFIKKIDNESNAGDMIYLLNGQLVVINDSAVTLYRDWDHWVEGDWEEMMWLSNTNKRAA